MQIEYKQWQKRLRVSHRIRKFLIPGYIVVSTASSSHYFHSGIERLKEKNSVVFQYTLSGRGIFEIDGNKHTLNVGQSFCCYVADEKIKYYYPNDSTEDWTFLYVTYYDKLGVTKALNDQLGYLFTIDPSEPQIKQILKYGDIEDSTIEMLAGSAHVFINSIIGMLANQTQFPEKPISTQLTLVRKAIKIIESKLETPYNASMLASELGVSQEHLNRVFQLQLKKSPYRCICENKIHLACDILKNTNLSIFKIALTLGYEPGSHFARLFKRIIGVTPSQFRISSSIPIKPIIAENI